MDNDWTALDEFDSNLGDIHRKREGYADYMSRRNREEDEKMKKQVPDLSSMITDNDIYLEEMQFQKSEPNYAFNEGALLKEITEYVNKTYGEHYAQNKYQATQFIEDAGHGMGFSLGNVMKYAQRYGKKAGANRADLLKVIHYGIIALAMHDNQHTKCGTGECCGKCIK